jgi:hypothetical protein
MSDRRADAREQRVRAAETEFARAVPEHRNNGEEADYAPIANYSKGLPHNEFGEADPSAYRLLRRAVATGQEEDYERIPLGGDRPLTNPRAGLSFDLEGPDAQALTMPPAPRIDQPWNSAEMAELYWMALCRDVPFTRFEGDPLVAEAAADLSTAYSDLRAPRQGGEVTPGTLFRGDTRGDLVGPYLSQFLLKDVPYGTLLVRQLQDTPEKRDFLTDVTEWLKVQNGADRTPTRNRKERRYIQTPRDMAHYVHFDALYEAYLNACLILLGMDAPLDAGNPYNFSANQAGFGTFGGPHVLSLVTEVATRALKAVWFQKWNVHRRLRPEEFGGRVHMHLTGRRDYPMIDQEILDSRAVKSVHEKHGSFLLPQAFPEGSPTHPAYGAGHATVAGACVTVLKAWFDESTPITDPVVPDEAGTTLVPYKGPDAEQLTVGGELNKVAANVAIGRSMAGVHWRSDYSESVRLGEEIAIGILRELKCTSHERFSFTLSRFDGTAITI